jgi:YgiT-type zinc finger domain-containing protein
MDAKDPRWQKLIDEILSGMQEWRKQHPKATFAEIECETMKRTAVLQARMAEDVAQTSEAADWVEGEGPSCPECGAKMHKRGKAERHLQGPGGQEVVLNRTYADCPSCGAELFPPG